MKVSDKFWNFLEKIGEPFFGLFDKLEFLIPYLIPLFAVVGDFSVIYTIIYFIINSMPGYGIPILLLVTVPILYFFHLGLIDIIKSWIGKKDKK